MLDQLARVARLYDFYGPLLTPKQRQWLEFHYHNDLSLGEIAKEEGISRQAVYDSLQRAIRALEDYEAHLGYLQRGIAVRQQLATAVRYLESYYLGGREGDLSQALYILRRLLELPEGSLQVPEQKTGIETD